MTLPDYTIDTVAKAIRALDSPRLARLVELVQGKVKKKKIERVL